MGIRMVRQPSETPNVTNIDDIIPFRYAYGDQNGYVIGKGTEISYTIEGNTFRVNSGRVVLQGVETDIDANGVSFTIDNSSETRYFVIYYEVNLATQTTSIKLSDYSTNGYPSIDTGDDLTVNASGIARTELYRFTATNSVISNVEKTAKAIEYIDEFYINNKIVSNFATDEVSKFNNKILPKLKLLYSRSDGVNINGIGRTTIFSHSTSLLDKYLMVEHGIYGDRQLSFIKTTNSTLGNKIYNDVNERGMETNELFSYYNVSLRVAGTSYRELQGQAYCDGVKKDLSTFQKSVDYYIYSVYEVIF